MHSLRHHGLLALAALFAGFNPERSASSRPQKIAAPRFSPYVDRVGMPHGRSGDKLVRKAMTGVVGIRAGRRGPLHSLLIVKRSRFPFSATKR